MKKSWYWDPEWRRGHVGNTAAKHRVVRATIGSIILFSDIYFTTKHNLKLCAWCVENWLRNHSSEMFIITWDWCLARSREEQQAVSSTRMTGGNRQEITWVSNANAMQFHFIETSQSTWNAPRCRKESKYKIQIPNSSVYLRNEQCSRLLLTLSYVETTKALLEKSRESSRHNSRHIQIPACIVGEEILMEANSPRTL